LDFSASGLWRIPHFSQLSCHAIVIILRNYCIDRDQDWLTDRVLCRTLDGVSSDGRGIPGGAVCRRPGNRVMDEVDRKAVERSVAARLVSSGKLDEAALDRVLRVQANNDERLEALLIKLGLASERDVAEALSRELDLVIAEVADYPEAPVLDGKLAGKFLRHSGILPLADGNEGLLLAMVDPLNGYVTRAVEMASGRRVVRRIALPTDLEAAYARLYEAEKMAPGQAADLLGDSGADEELLEDVGRLRDLASEVPVIRLVNQLIARAIDVRASDIHIEPLQTGCSFVIASMDCCVKRHRRPLVCERQSSRASRSWPS
jgi:hypothetical protein